MRYWWVSSSIIALDVSRWAGLSLIWVIGNNMTESKTPVPLCQTLRCCYARLSVGPVLFLLCINDMHRSSTGRLFFILLTIQQFLHPTLTLKCSWPTEAWSWASYDMNIVNVTVGCKNRCIVSKIKKCIWLRIYACHFIFLNVCNTSYMIISN